MSKARPAHAANASIANGATRATGAANSSNAERKRQAAHSGVPSRIKLLFESRDGKLCLFEDAEGHLTAVRAARLA